MTLLHATHRRPPAIIWFERLGIVGIALDFIQLVLLFPRRVAVDGVPLALAFTALIPLLSLTLLLLASRGRNSAARWMLAVLVGVAIITAFRAGTSAWWSDAPVLLGVLVLLLEAAAVAFSFAPATRGWFNGQSKVSPGG